VKSPQPKLKTKKRKSLTSPGKATPTSQREVQFIEFPSHFIIPLENDNPSQNFIFFTTIAPNIYI